MMSFRGTGLAEMRLPLGTVWLLESLAESKGRQALYEKQSPQILKALRELAMVESAESSNRIEGVIVEHDRLRPLVLRNSRPRDRSEEEIVGYRKALSWVHASHAKIGIEPGTFRRLHALAQGGTGGDAGQWKQTQNDIIEVDPSGRRVVRFRPVEPTEVPVSMVTPLLATACFVLDFLCIHPFRDGNGRVARLLALLALYHHGYEVGRYISLERVVEQTKESHYDTLKQSSVGWHEGAHDALPWFSYFLAMLRMAYREFEERAGRERPARGSKAELIAYALANVPSPLGIADVERLCPSVSREMIRVVMNRWRKEGRLQALGRGRDARWRRVNPE